MVKPLFSARQNRSRPALDDIDASIGPFPEPEGDRHSRETIEDLIACLES